MWKWFKLTDESFEALRKANVPDAVLEKLTHLRNKDLSRKDLAQDITKALDTIEMELYQNLILNHALELQGKARLLKRLNRCIGISFVYFITMWISLFISAGLLHLRIIPFIMVVTGMIVGFSGMVMSMKRDEILKKIPLGSENDYSEEFSFLHPHPARYKPALLLPFSLRVRILIWLGIIVGVYVLIRIGIIGGFFSCFILFLTFVLLPSALFCKFPQIDPEQPPDAKKK